jgi:ribosomal protein S18 acetylase RimI-like enzyme
LEIRKAILEDADSIASLLLMAMEDIVFAFIGRKDSTEGKAFLQHFVAKENNQYSFQNCWVIESDDSKVLAVANVYNGADLHRLREPVLAFIKYYYDEKFTVNDETQAGEYYLDTFAVDPDFRNQGLGKKLLNYVIQKLVIQDQKTLGLLVENDNISAKKLYQNLGFIHIGNKVLVGKELEHWQARPSHY